MSRGSSPRSSGANSFSMIAQTPAQFACAGSAPRASPQPVTPASVSTRTRAVSKLTVGP